MLRIVLLGKNGWVTLEKALVVLGDKVIAFNKTEHWIVIPRTAGDEALIALRQVGISAELDSLAPAKPE